VDYPFPRRRHPDPHVRLSIYPAVQNMLLAARALGLGATLTTLYLQFEKEAEAALGLPRGVHSYALLPIGYPMGGSGQSAVSRSPMSSTRIDGVNLTGICRTNESCIIARATVIQRSARADSRKRLGSDELLTLHI
jgi:hypothetical protein